ncbi:PulJ/GspJ family protein [Pontiella sulfatireligans]|uniref:Type II secretion system protein J n=1 Tax=Pontiella sulfatireligans TaxID=2750658 RepID=A0A6C2USD1_9BACT|nr:prepilin-type N-terminal cleavage/methylation domain-containing protein [Pontiella sulfatireligans]VGO23039.1 hypothetical protein SCARR_05138 [Pontiella sulfatireligans]
MKSAKTKSGFTLLEIVVSISILAVMALMISRIFSESTRAVERGQDQTLLDETARLLLDVIEQDVSQALIRTNVAFRVHPLDGNDALYFISTGMRRQLSTIPRDTAPMRLQAELSPSQPSDLHKDWNRYIRIQTPAGSAVGAPGGNWIQRLIAHSDYYCEAGEPSADFAAICAGTEMPATSEERFHYTQALRRERVDSNITYKNAGEMSHASLSFMDITVNGRIASNYVEAEDGAGPLPDATDRPHFVDVAIGLISSTDLEQAMRLRSGGEQARGQEHIQNNERIYTRRIFMRNQGAEQLSFDESP